MHTEVTKKLQDENVWQRVRPKLRSEWTTLTDQELDQVREDGDKLVDLIKRKTGQTPEAIEAKIKQFAA